ncbi:MAG: acyltransferase [Candidatus Taylorbacteria bacterium]|nr:acyltransferase [Candidatus Taylorbacteria bacterium]
MYPMNISPFSSLFYFIVMAIIFVCADIVAKRIPFYSDMTRAEPKSASDHKGRSRHEVLDGLRGILALGVLFQHAVTNYTYYQTGVWKITEYAFYRHAGGEAVILFFMITSFLYWSKAIASEGRINAQRLYINRFNRLAPMYLVSACIVTISVLIISNFHISSWYTFFRDIASWLTLGLVTTVTVNDLSVIPINAGIHWTLHFEWVFYLLLPFFAIALRPGWYRFLAIPFALLAFILPGWGYWIIFFFGITAAHIVRKYPRMDFLKKKRYSVLPIIGLVLVYLMQHEPYSVPQYAVTMCILLCFIYGNSLFGLLRTKAAIFLGTISYSVYLLHGIMLYAVLGVFNMYVPIQNLHAYTFWSLIAFSGICTVLVSAWTYRYIEYPFLRVTDGKRV